MPHSPIFVVQRVTINESDTGKDAGFKPVMAVNPCSLQWANVEFITECNLLDNFRPFDAPRLGTYIYCKSGFGIYCTNSYQKLSGQFLAYLKTSLAAVHLNFKAN